MAQQTAQRAFGLALQHHQAGRLPEAERLYVEILEHEPDHADALHHRGMIAGQRGQYDAAVEMISRSLTLKPDYPQAHNNLGNALQSKGRHDDAIRAYRRAILLKPNYADALSGLGTVLREKGEYSEALTAHKEAVALGPKEALFRYNLANTLRAIGRLDDAIDGYRHAISLRPGYPEANFALGTALQDDGMLDEAIDAYRQSVAKRPSFAEAHWNLALALLARGDFLEGWTEHKWRWECPGLPRRRNFPQPEWDGSSLAGQTIFLHPEQGHGDTLQFIRYAPLVAARGATVIVGSVPELHRLLPSVPGVSRWIASGETLPPFDTHCPLMSLPAAFGTTFDSIPQDVPYLHADPADVDRWRGRLFEEGVVVSECGCIGVDDTGVAHPDTRRSAASSTGARHTFRVGLVWAGSSAHVNDRNRSLPLAAFAPLAKVPGVTFYSLQKSEPAAQAKSPPPGMNLIDYTADLNDFADTAALIANLDLTISVDTSVVHLAGAMGMPVWTLLPFTTDWRWQVDRSDNPWYPSMRLFRQPARGDWEVVIERVAEALALCVE